MRIFLWSLFLICFSLSACQSKKGEASTNASQPDEPTFYRGADLSYVNEMLDCGAVYYDEQGIEKDPYRIFKDAQANLVRVRLWHTPEWTDYSSFQDVRNTIARSKELGMKVLLDFHYSDDWADPHKQMVPAAWLPVVNEVNILGDSIYNYTFDVLAKLQEQNLLPELVQVGNEINIEILQDTIYTDAKINWKRNAFLINKGLQAVKDAAMQFEAEISTVLHIAQPENALLWFDEAHQNRVTNYDWIGISYYPKWSEYSINELPGAIQTLIKTYNKPLMVVETAYPYTLNNADKANNILGKDAAIPEFEISPMGQYNYLKYLEEKIIEGGGAGLIYWEPAWVSTACSTRWGQGSHWDNATLFDQNNRPNIGMQYFKGE